MTAPRTALIAVTSFLAGVLITGVGAYYWIRLTSDFLALLPYQSAASSGALYVTILRDIRSGQVDKAKGTLEALVDNELVTLGVGADEIRKRRLEGALGRPVSAIRAYRREFPSTQPDASVRATMQRGLALADHRDDGRGP